MAAESLRRIVGVAVAEWGIAIRSRRVLVVTLLFVAVAALVMYATLAFFSALEQAVAESLSLPDSASPGSMAAALWQSPPFLRAMRHFARGSLVFDDLVGRHPVHLAYAFFMFNVVPLLTLLMAAPRIADDVRGGSARYFLMRVTRTEWTLGKFLGESWLLAAAMGVGTLAAWAMALIELPPAEAAGLLPGICEWMVRAWVYAFAWLGLFLALSHLPRSGGKATVLGILAMMAAVVWPRALAKLVAACPALGWTEALDLFAPQTAQALLWRRSPAAIFQGVVTLGALAFFYLALGAAVFRRRDV